MRTYRGMHEAEGSAAKILGVLMILIGAYVFVSLYNLLSLKIPITQEQLLIICAAATIIGGIYMIAKGGHHRYY